MTNLYWKIPSASLSNITPYGDQTNALPHKKVHYAISGSDAIVQGDYSDSDVASISQVSNVTHYGKYKSGKIQAKDDFDTFKGINIPWLKYSTGEEVAHDGYSNGFQDTYFNGAGANNDIKSQLDILADNGITYARLWLNIFSNFNTDKETEGYTGFIDNFLTNVSTFCDWCFERGISLIICIDDGWYTFPWHWLNTSKEASYTQACSDIVTALKGKPAVWGYDYANEPYHGWSSQYVHTHNDQDNTLDYDRDYLTGFFQSLYTTLKAINPQQYFSVGESKPSDNSSYSISDACDFYQLHWYGADPGDFTYSSSDYDKLVIIGEYGYSSAPHSINGTFDSAMIAKLNQQGFDLHMIWNLSELISKQAVNDPYTINAALTTIKNI